MNMYDRVPEGSERLSESEKVEQYVRSFEEPADHLLTQLDENIRKGEYSYILGLDASGRIPALIVGKYISEIYTQESRELPKRLFVAPQYEAVSTPQLKALFSNSEKIKETKKKVLIIDDTLFSGDSLRDATMELRKHGIPFDIGIFLAFNKDEEDIERIRIALDADALYVGEHTVFVDKFDDMNVVTPIIKRKELSGVYRGYSSDNTFSRRNVSKKNIPDNSLFRLGRKYATALAKDLMEKHSQKVK